MFFFTLGCPRGVVLRAAQPGRRGGRLPGHVSRSLARIIVPARHLNIGQDLQMRKLIIN